MFETVVFALILLHGPDGREIDISIDEITSLNCKIPGSNKFYVEGANAVIGMTDGKNVAVREPCEEIKRLILEAQK